MLLRCVNLHLYRESIVFPEYVLNRIYIVLAHITEPAAVVVPVSTESLVDTVRVVRLVRSRAEPEIIVQTGRDRLRDQVLLPCPVELPCKTCRSGNADRKRPSQQTAVDQFFQRLHCRPETIESILEPEPCIQAENPSVPLHGLHHPLAFPDGAGHRLLAEDVLSCPGGFHSHNPMPVRRCGYVHYIHIRIMYKVAEIMIGLQCFPEFRLGQVHAFLQMLRIHIADSYKPAAFIACEMV